MERTACEKCGLRAVRYELERQGITLRFCDTCYWGELEASGRPSGRDVEEKPAGTGTPPKKCPR